MEKSIHEDRRHHFNEFNSYAIKIHNNMVLELKMIYDHKYVVNCLVRNLDYEIFSDELLEKVELLKNKGKILSIINKCSKEELKRIVIFINAEIGNKKSRKQKLQEIKNNIFEDFQLKQLWLCPYNVKEIQQALGFKRPTRELWLAFGIIQVDISDCKGEKEWNELGFSLKKGCKPRGFKRTFLYSKDDVSVGFGNKVPLEFHPVRSKSAWKKLGFRIKENEKSFHIMMHKVGKSSKWVRYGVYRECQVEPIKDPFDYCIKVSDIKEIPEYCHHVLSHRGDITRKLIRYSRKNKTKYYKFGHKYFFDSLIKHLVFSKENDKLIQKIRLKIPDTDMCDLKNYAILLSLVNSYLLARKRDEIILQKYFEMTGKSTFNWRKEGF